MIKKAILLAAIAIFMFSGFMVSAENSTNLLAGEEPTGCTIRARFSIGDNEFEPGQRIEAEEYDDWGLICLIATVHYVTNWIFYLIMIIVMVMVLYGAFIFLTSSGDPTKTARATKTITFAVIGLIVALLARAVPSAVRYITGIS
jgi:hypothetical protein